MQLPVFNKQYNYIYMQGGHKETLTFMFYSCMSTGSWVFLKNIFGAHLAQSRFQFFPKLLMKN